MTPLLWLLLVGGIAAELRRALRAELKRIRETPRTDLHPLYHETRCYNSLAEMVASVGGRVVEDRD